MFSLIFFGSVAVVLTMAILWAVAIFDVPLLRIAGLALALVPSWLMHFTIPDQYGIGTGADTGAYFMLNYWPVAVVAVVIGACEYVALNREVPEVAVREPKARDNALTMASVAEAPSTRHWAAT